MSIENPYLSPLAQYGNTASAYALPDLTGRDQWHQDVTRQYAGMTRDEYIQAIQGATPDRAAFNPYQTGEGDMVETFWNPYDERNQLRSMGQDGYRMQPVFDDDGRVSDIETFGGNRDGLLAATALFGGVAGLAGLAGGAGAAGAGAAIPGGGTAGLGALGAPMSMPAGMGGATTAVGSGTVLAPGIGATAGAGTVLANPSGGFMDTVRNAIGGLNPGQVIGGIGGAIEAATAPDTLTTTSTNGLSPEAQSRVNGLMDMTQGQIGQSNPFTNDAANQIAGIAGDQSGINGAIGANQGFVQNGGQNAYAGQNPFLNNMINQGVDDIGRGYQQIGQSNDTTANRSNIFGGSAWRQMNQDNQRAFGTAAGNYVNNARFGDYQMQAGLDESRLGRQQSAISMAPALDQARYTGANQMLNAGNQQFNQQQQNYQNYANAVGTNANANRTASQTGNNPNAGNPFSQGLGGAIVGGQLWNGWQGN